MPLIRRFQRLAGGVDVADHEALCDPLQSRPQPVDFSDTRSGIVSGFSLSRSGGGVVTALPEAERLDIADVAGVLPEFIERAHDGSCLRAARRAADCRLSAGTAPAETSDPPRSVAEVAGAASAGSGRMFGLVAMTLARSLRLRHSRTLSATRAVL